MEEKKLYEQCIEYVYNNLNTLTFDLPHTYSRMCVNRTPLHLENKSLFQHIMDLVEDFGIDNDLDENWWVDEMIDVENVFDDLLKYFV